MTGTDLPRPGRRHIRDRRSGPRPPAVAALVVLAGLGLAILPAHGGLAAQEPQRVTIRSGSGWIGVNVRVVTSSESADDVITLTDVLAGSPAAAAGLQPGDRVIRVNGVPVDAERFRSVTSRLEAGDPIALTVVRNGQELDLPVVAGQRPAPAQIVAVRLQEELDSVRSHMVRILEAPEPAEAPMARARGTRFAEAPTIRVEQVGADSIATRILIETPGGPILALVETPEGIREAEVVKVSGLAAVHPGPEDERRVRVLEAEARAAVAEAEAVWLPRLGQEAREAEERARGLRGGEPPADAWPMRSIEEVRPLSPYLAGLTRVAGAELRTLNPGLGEYFGVDEGLLVTEVAEGTPAAEAGLRGGDVIVTSGGRAVTTLAELRESLATREGRRLEVIRAGERLTVTLR